MKTHKTIRGVTLIEIAIVLVIIGLLLGGVLKGQELINNARVRAIADQQLGMQVAWNAFQERYQAMPGDFPRATRYIKSTRNGAGDGVISRPSSTGSFDMFLVFNHLTEAGLLRCSECQLLAAEITTLPTNFVIGGSRGLRNAYGGIMGIFHDDGWYQTDGNIGAHVTGNFLLLSHTGPLVPSNILSEVDLKIDDGYSNVGSFRYSAWLPTITANSAIAGNAQIGQCTNTEAGAAATGIAQNGRLNWRFASRAPAAFQNCSASLALQ